MTLSADQRTKIRESVLVGSNVPRVDNVNFAVSVGTVVPSTVHIVAVPEALIAIHPEWRGDEYFVVRDEIIIVDRDRRIVAQVPVGSSSAELENSGGSSAMSHDGGGSLNLSQEEIRQLQVALNSKGFNIGAPDGVLGPRTREALILFQRREGFQATGQIDSRTVTALGISSKAGQSMGGQSGMQQPSGSQGAAQPGGHAQQPSAMPGAGQPGQSTAGQGAGQPSSQGQQSTTGQAGAAQPSANPGAAQPSANPGAAQPSANPGAANRPAGAPQSGSGAPMTGGQTR